MLGKIEGRRRRGMTEDEMVGRHHQLDGQTLGDGEGQEVSGMLQSMGTQSLTPLSNNCLDNRLYFQD